MQRRRHGRIAVRIARRGKNGLQAVVDGARTHQREGVERARINRRLLRGRSPGLAARDHSVRTKLVGRLELDKLEVARTRVFEHQAVTAHVRKAVRQDTLEHRARQVAIVCKLGSETRTHRSVHREDKRLAGTRHGHVEQAGTLLELRLTVLADDAKERLGGRARGAHVVHQLGHQPLVKQLLEVLLNGYSVHARVARGPPDGKALRKRDGVHPVRAGMRLHAPARDLDVKAVRDRDHRELQALGRVDRHDANRGGIPLVERTRSLLALQKGIEGQRDLPGGIAQVEFELRDHVERLENIGRLGAPLGTPSRQAHEPTGLVHHVARNARERIVPGAGKGAAQDLAGAVKKRQPVEPRRVLSGRHQAKVEIAAARLTRLGIKGGGECQELLHAQGKQGRGQQRGETARGVERVREGAHERLNRGDLGRGGEHRAARDDAIEPLGAEGLGVDAGARHASQQQDHISHGLAGVRHGAEPARDRRGLGNAALIGLAARDQYGLTTRRAHGGQRVLPALVGLQIQKAAHEAALCTVEHLRHVLEDLCMAAEITDELDEGARGRPRRGRLGDRTLLTAKHLDVGAAEAVDGLLRIAHGAQRAGIWARKLHDEVDLLLVGILELVDHHHLEAPRVRLAHGGAIAKGLAHTAQQVVVVEQRGRIFERAVLGLHHAAKLEQLAHRGRRARDGRVDKGIGGLGLEQGHLVFGERLGGTGRLACEHADGQVVKGLLAMLKGLDGVQRLARTRRGGRARLKAGTVRVRKGGEVDGAVREAHVVESVGHARRELEHPPHQRAHARARLATARRHLAAQGVAGQQ